ncbi:MAG: dTDP-glucose 4,6-dehydratase [Anaerolineales bacterium]
MLSRVLVTGGAGFIGSNFVRYLLSNNPHSDVITLDALTYAGNLDNLSNLPDPARHTFVRGDICDDELVAKILIEHRIDTIVNFAAETHVDRSIHGPRQFMRTNVQGVLSLLEAARTQWLGGPDWEPEQCRFHHISTDEVYGSLGPDDPSFGESTPYAPRSPYAASKAAADHLVRAYFHTYDLPATLSNCSNNYGPYQYPEKLISLVILNALEGIPLPIYGDGQQIRDWLHVEDHVAAVALVVEQGKVGETYNIGAGVQIANLKLVEQICDLIDELRPATNSSHRDLIRFVEDRPGHDRRYAMDSRKIRSELQWEPVKSLEQGLRETVEWYREHTDWVDAIRARPEYQQWLRQNYGTRGDSN